MDFANAGNIYIVYDEPNSSLEMDQQLTTQIETVNEVWLQISL